MFEWERLIQSIVDEIDDCIRKERDDALTLSRLSERLGYSVYYTTRRFRQITGWTLREYLRRRRLAFALKDVRDGNDRLLDIALRYGFSSHAAFTRAFRTAFGVSPAEFRSNPGPVVLRTKLNPFDRYFFGVGEIGMVQSEGGVKVYFITIPAHKFLHIKNRESIGYWDFWQKQSLIPGQDCETICGLLDSVKGKLDDVGGSEPNSGAGQVMGYLNDPEGRVCSWGIPLAECYGVRLPADWKGQVPEQLLLLDVPEGEYVVFEHGPFDYEQENGTVGTKIEEAMSAFDYEAAGVRLDLTPGRVFYFYHDPKRFWKFVRPVVRA